MTRKPEFTDICAYFRHDIIQKFMENRPEGNMNAGTLQQHMCMSNKTTPCPLLPKETQIMRFGKLITILN
jgi:hypothetical protein